jgi:hypothetical protein
VTVNNSPNINNVFMIITKNKNGIRVGSTVVLSCFHLTGDLQHWYRPLWPSHYIGVIYSARGEHYITITSLRMYPLALYQVRSNRITCMYTVPTKHRQSGSVKNGVAVMSTTVLPTRIPFLFLVIIMKTCGRYQCCRSPVRWKQLWYVASSLRTQHSGVRGKTGCIGD